MAIRQEAPDSQGSASSRSISLRSRLHLAFRAVWRETLADALRVEGNVDGLRGVPVHGSGCEEVRCVKPKREELD